mmetsp:Transcript_34074/g.101850  ORF Transcript_34074/g.101850 Transcript_34074/m.101850 type:complete len:202 (-) Transcript_34074:112-717(-)
MKLWLPIQHSHVCQQNSLGLLEAASTSQIPSLDTSSAQAQQATKQRGRRTIHPASLPELHCDGTLLAVNLRRNSRFSLSGAFASRAPPRSCILNSHVQGILLSTMTREGAFPDVVPVSRAHVQVFHLANLTIALGLGAASFLWNCAIVCMADQLQSLTIRCFASYNANFAIFYVIMQAFDDMLSLAANNDFLVSGLVLVRP